MLKGAFSGFIFFKVGAITAIFSLFLIYYQSQYYHHQPPFPHRTISQTATHYPQFLSFRLGTITGAAMIVLGWFTNFFVLQTVSIEHGINLSKYHPQIPLVTGTMGGLFLMASTALIDTGHMNQTLHEWCATSFFIVSFFAQVYNVVIVVDIQKRTNAFNQINIYFKYFILFMLALQLVGSFAVEEGLLDNEIPEDNKGNFYEWTLTATIISMFLSIGIDCNRFQLIYTQQKQNEGQY